MRTHEANVIDRTLPSLILANPPRYTPPTFSRQMTEACPIPQKQRPVKSATDLSMIYSILTVLFLLWDMLPIGKIQ